MNCGEIKISLHDYIDEQLDILTKKKVKDHLHICDNCFNEYQRLQDFFNVLKRLPYTLEPQEDIIKEFSKDLLNLSNLEQDEDVSEQETDNKKIKREQKKQEERLKANWSVAKKSRASKTIINRPYTRHYHASSTNWRRILLLPIALIILGAAYFIYDFQKRNSPWSIEKVSGEININGKSTTVSQISQGETIYTSGDSRLFLLIPKVGKIELMPNTSIFLEKTKDENNEIKIEKGSIRVINSAEMPELSIDLSNASIYDKSGIFTLTVDQEKNGEVFVETGLVEIKTVEENIFVKEGYGCRIKNGNLPGLPYRIVAADSLKKEIRIFDDAVDNESTVQSIISLSGKEDVLTLLALIPRVSLQERQILFQTIANYFPPPFGVTRMGILKADKEMLYMWWEEMEWEL
jgi:ferredoxin-fold anticodon binding domain-containing protein